MYTEHNSLKSRQVDILLKYMNLLIWQKNSVQWFD